MELGFPRRFAGSRPHDALGVPGVAVFASASAHLNPCNSSSGFFLFPLTAWLKALDLWLCFSLHVILVELRGDIHHMHVQHYTITWRVMPPS